MKLREIMSKSVESIPVNSSLTEAANTMARLDIGFLPVVDGPDVVGAITDRDIVVRALAEALNPAETPVSEIMTKQLETVSPDEDVEEAARIMEEKQIRRLVLCDDSGAYLGVVSLGDLAYRAHSHELSGEALEKVCEREHA